MCPALLQLEGNTLSPGHSSLHTKTSSESPTLCGLKHKCALEVAVCLCCNWLPKHKDKFERDFKVGNKMSGLSEGSACGLSLAKLSCVSTISFYILYHLVSAYAFGILAHLSAYRRILHWTYIGPYEKGSEVRSSCQWFLGETTAAKIYRRCRDQVGSKKLPSDLTGHLSIRNLMIAMQASTQR